MGEPDEHRSCSWVGEDDERRSCSWVGEADEHRSCSWVTEDDERRSCSWVTEDDERRSCSWVTEDAYLYNRGHHFLGCRSKRQAFAPNIQLSYVGPRAGTVKQPNFQLGSGQVINLTLAAFRWEIRSRPATTGTLTEWHRHCQAAQLSARVRSANRPDPTFHLQLRSVHRSSQLATTEQANFQFRSGQVAGQVR